MNHLFALHVISEWLISALPVFILRTSLIIHLFPLYACSPCKQIRLIKVSLNKVTVTLKLHFSLSLSNPSPPHRHILSLITLSPAHAEERSVSSAVCYWYWGLAHFHLLLLFRISTDTHTHTRALRYQSVLQYCSLECLPVCLFTYVFFTLLRVSVIHKLPEIGWESREVHKIYMGLIWIAM